MRVQSLCSSFVVVLVAFQAVLVQNGAEASTARKIQILNEVTGPIEVYWIHPTTREATLMSTPDVMAGANFNLDSFVGHEFEIRDKEKCEANVKSPECRSKFFNDLIYH